MEEYTLNTRAKSGLTVLAIITSFFSLFLFSLLKGGLDIRVILPLFALAGSLLLIIYSQRKIVKYDDRIVYSSMLWRRELTLNDIRGYRKDAKGFILESSKSSIKISGYAGFYDIDSLIKWMETRYPDLNELDLKNNQNELLNDASLGATAEEREKRLHWAKEVALAYNVWGGVLALFCALITGKASIIILEGYVLLGLVVIATGRGLIKFISDHTSVYPFVFIGFGAPAGSLFLQSINYEFISLDNLWMPALLTALLISAILIPIGINKQFRSLVGQIALMFALCFAFAFGSIRMINCGFDDSKVTVYEATIQDKSIYHGKNTSYRLLIGAWGSQVYAEEINVSQQFYNRVAIGSTVLLGLKKGALGMSWYYLKE